MLYDLIIIGAGPAGITAGIYAARKRLKTLVLTKDFIGQVAKTSKVDNWPGSPGISGVDLIKAFENHLRKFEVNIEQGQEAAKVKKDKADFVVKTKSNKEFKAKAVIVATGSDPRPLEVPGEKELIGRGVSYCSTCDGPFFENKQVVVVGGGNAGFEAALDLTAYGKKIYIFERSEQVLADEILQEQVQNQKNKIEVLVNVELKEIIGKNKVEAIVYQDIKSKKTFQIPMAGVFVEIGSVPATGFLKGLAGIEFNEKDEIKVNLADCSTSCDGLFVAGDINDGKWKQIVIAAGEGCRAALAAYEYLIKIKNKK